jgi:hypothetical protein
LGAQNKKAGSEPAFDFGCLKGVNFYSSAVGEGF